MPREGGESAAGSSISTACFPSSKYKVLQSLSVYTFKIKFSCFTCLLPRQAVGGRRVQSSEGCCNAVGRWLCVGTPNGEHPIALRGGKAPHFDYATFCSFASGLVGVRVTHATAAIAATTSSWPMHDSASLACCYKCTGRRTSSSWRSGAGVLWPHVQKKYTCFTRLTFDLLTPRSS